MEEPHNCLHQLQSLNEGDAPRLACRTQYKAWLPGQRIQRHDGVLRGSRRFSGTALAPSRREITVATRTGIIPLEPPGATCTNTENFQPQETRIFMAAGGTMCRAGCVSTPRPTYPFCAPHPLPRRRTPSRTSDGPIEACLTPVALNALNRVSAPNFFEGID